MVTKFKILVQINLIGLYDFFDLFFKNGEMFEIIFSFALTQNDGITHLSFSRIPDGINEVEVHDVMVDYPALIKF